MKGKYFFYPDNISNIGSVQILTLSEARKITILIKGKWLVLG